MDDESTNDAEAERLWRPLLDHWTVPELPSGLKERVMMRIDSTTWARDVQPDPLSRPQPWALVCRVLGRAGRGHLAEDISQDALLAVLRSLPRYEPQIPSRFGAWVLTIAARTALSEIRRRREVAPMIEVAARVVTEAGHA